jgi:hypothetical protein
MWFPHRINAIRPDITRMSSYQSSLRRGVERMRVAIFAPESDRKKIFSLL